MFALAIERTFNNLLSSCWGKKARLFIWEVEVIWVSKCRR